MNKKKFVTLLFLSVLSVGTFGIFQNFTSSVGTNPRKPIMTFAALYKKNVIQGTSRLDGHHFLISQDPDGSEHKNKLSFSILDLQGKIIKSFSLDDSLNELRCPPETCGSHAQSILAVPDEKNNEYKVIVENSKNNGFLVFSLKYKVENYKKIFTSMHFVREIIPKSSGKKIKIGLFGADFKNDRLAIAHWKKDELLISIYENAFRYMENNVSELGNPVLVVKADKDQMLKRHIQGIALSDHSFYLLTGRVSIFNKKLLYRYSLKDGKVESKYHITEGLKEALKDSEITTAEGDIALAECPSGQAKCSFNYFEPEALHISDGNIYFTIVTKEKGLKINRMYKLSENELKYELKLVWGPQERTPHNKGKAGKNVYLRGDTCGTWTTVECNGTFMTNRGLCRPGLRYSTDYKEHKCIKNETNVVWEYWDAP